MELSENRPQQAEAGGERWEDFQSDSEDGEDDALNASLNDSSDSDLVACDEDDVIEGSEEVMPGWYERRALRSNIAKQKLGLMLLD